MKLDSSSTTRSVFSIRPSSGSNETPMFPPTHVVNFRFRIAPSIADVVDFPFVPVTPTIVAGHRSMNSRISVVTGTPASAPPSDTCSPAESPATRRRDRPT